MKKKGIIRKAFIPQGTETTDKMSEKHISATSERQRNLTNSYVHLYLTYS